MPPPLDLAQLIRAHQAGLWRYLRLLGCDRTLAEDLIQETFLAVFERPFEQYSTAASAAYLRTVARNLYLGRLRREGRSTVTVNWDRLDAVWTRWAGRDQGETLLDTLGECLAQLDERSRLALEMRYRQEASRGAIAQALGLSEDGAKNLLQRAKLRLRECLERKLSR